MILTDFYSARKHPEVTSKWRYDVYRSTGSYDLFEQVLINKRRANVGGLSFQFIDTPDAWNRNGARKPAKAITRTRSITGIFVPDPTIQAGYGDIRGTSDAVLIRFQNDPESGSYTKWPEMPDVIDILIARGQLNNSRNLYLLFCDGELDEEILTLHNQSNTLFNYKQSNDNDK